ncbi:hypothetical protein BDQ17DRAFT_1364220 [Cyathus striatus]|nr:hypothetical protein BDQ17DRAFT_1364220 [Cyathus striatus]
MTYRLVLQRPLVTTDCMRMMYYASRVQYFFFDTFASARKEVDITIYQALQALMQDDKILPNVRLAIFGNLDVLNLTQSGLLKISMLPYLRELHISQWRTESDIASSDLLEVCTSDVEECIVLLEVKKSWPVKSLELAFTKCRPTTISCRSLDSSTITLLDLIPFAQHCPNLTELGIFIDAIHPPVVSNYTGYEVVQSALTWLNVNDSPAADHSHIAAFLSRTFPSLREIETVESLEGDSDVVSDDSDLEDVDNRAQVWSRVKKLLNAAVKE